MELRHRCSHAPWDVHGDGVAQPRIAHERVTLAVTSRSPHDLGAPELVGVEAVRAHVPVRHPTPRGVPAASTRRPCSIRAARRDRQ